MQTLHGSNAVRRIRSYAAQQRSGTDAVAMQNGADHNPLCYKMFYKGDLQSGISEAVQASKIVACFVTDHGEESQIWENEFLHETNLQSGLSSQVILLRLVAGSQEAGFLAAIYPLPKTPALVLIRDGELKEYLASGTTKEEFLRRLTAVLRSDPNVTVSSTSSASPVPPQTVPEMPQGQSSSSHASSSVTEQQSSAVQEVFAERRVRLEAQKSEQDAKEKAKRVADARARREALEASGVPTNKNATDRNYALMQKKRQQDARDERARILKHVDDDKAERRQREAERKAQAKAIMDGQSSTMAPSSRKSFKPSTDCALQVRLFDGSAIRSNFPATGTIQECVRPWIDEKQGSDIPYTIKHVVTPRLNKNIEASEENKSLQSIGLTPNATLILVPVSDFNAAYAQSSTRGIVTQGASTGLRLLSSGIGAVAGALASLLGSGASSSTVDRHDQLTPAVGTSAPAKFRTLRDQDERLNSQELYNGNALNFEPRKDEDNKKDD